MSPKAVVNQIKELSRSSNRRSELREYVSKLKNDQVEAIVPKCLSMSDGSDLLQTILSSFDDTPSCQVKIFKMIQLCMKRPGRTNNAVQIAVMFLSKCTSDQLVKMVDFCVDLIRTQGEGSAAWKDALPECLSILLKRRGIVSHCGTEMSVADFKSKSLTSLCHLNWPEESTAQIVCMFADIELGKDEHAMVVNKVCSNVSGCKPDGLPPLFHQLLRLCKTRNILVPLLRVDDYFKTRLYSKLKLRDGNVPDSESTNYEVDDIDCTSVEELQQALSTCLYHVSQGCASVDMRRTILKEWDKSRTLTGPFLCNVLLSIADAGNDSSACLAILKSCFHQQCTFRRSSVRSAWWRALDLEVVDTKLLITTLVDETKVHGQLTSKALLDLGMMLLSVWSRESAAEAMWALGQTIIVKLCRCHPGSLPTILSKLVDKMVSDGAVNAGKQYSDTLGLLSRHVPLTMCENSAAIQSVLEKCLLSGRDGALSCRVAEAVQPIARLNARVRDTILMLCRKGMFSREKETRRAAVSGLLGLLRRLKANQRGNVASASVHTINSDSHSLLTQISIDLHATQVGEGIKSTVNDSAVSVEIISILKRLLTQSGVVKEDFYNGLHRAVCNKPFLKDHVLELLLEHLSKYLTPEQHDGPFCPLVVEKCVEIKDADIVLVEPLSHLILAIQQLLLYNTLPDGEDDSFDMILDAAGPNLGATATLIRISDAMSSCHVEHYGLDNAIGLQDLLPESKAKAATVKQIVQCLEALMAYRINEWSLEHADQGAKVIHLFKAYQEIVDFTKTSSKAKKGQKTSPNPDKKGKRSRKGDGLKLNAMVKDQAGSFKLSPCLWDMRTAHRILTLLQSDSVPWAKTDTTTALRSKREFQRFATRGVCSALQNLKSSRLPSRTDSGYVHDVAKLIYERCIQRFETICAFDQQTCLHLLECFEGCLSICLSGNSSFCRETFAGVVKFSADMNIARTSDVILTSLAHCLELTRDNEMSSIDDGEPSAKKIIATLMKCIQLIVDRAPNHFFVKGCHIGVDEENFGEEALISLENYFRECAAAQESTLSPLLVLTSRRRQDWSLVDALATRIGKVMGLIDDETENANVSRVAEDAFPSLSEKTAPVYLGGLCSHLCLRCEAAQKALTTIAEMSTSNRGHKDACRTLFVELCRLSNTLSLCCSAQVPVGRASDSVLRLACDHYALLSNVMKHLTARVGAAGLEAGNYLLQYCRLAKLLQVSGKRLSNVVDLFITHVGTEDTTATRSKVLTHTRAIPRLVFEIENYTKNLMNLEKKCKQNFQRYMSLGTARDFRIQAPILKEVLNTARETSNDNIQDVTECEEAEEPIAAEAVGSDHEEDDSAVEDSILDSDSEEDEVLPPNAKKPRLD